MKVRLQSYTRRVRRTCLRLELAIEKREQLSEVRLLKFRLNQDKVEQDSGRRARGEVDFAE